MTQTESIIAQIVGDSFSADQLIVAAVEVMQRSVYRNHLICLWVRTYTQPSDLLSQQWAVEQNKAWYLWMSITEVSPNIQSVCKNTLQRPSSSVVQCLWLCVDCNAQATAASNKKMHNTDRTGFLHTHRKSEKAWNMILSICLSWKVKELVKNLKKRRRRGLLYSLNTLSFEEKCNIMD